MSKHIFSVSFSVLKLTRETTIRGTRWIPGVAEQRLSTPVVFTAAFLETSPCPLTYLSPRLIACVAVPSVFVLPSKSAIERELSCGIRHSLSQIS